MYTNGKKWHFDGAVIFFQEGSEKKVGFIASKKVGNAVKRNLAKRRMRAIFDEIADSLKDGAYVLVAKKQIEQMSYEAFKKGLNWSLKRMQCLIL